MIPEIIPMDTVLIAVQYYKSTTNKIISYKDIENEIKYLFSDNSTNFKLDEFVAKNDIRWNYTNSTFTNDIKHKIKFIGLSRIDGAMMFIVDKNYVPIELSIKELFGTINLSYNTIRKNLTFKDFLRKEKINNLINNIQIDNSIKYLINYEPNVRLISVLEDHIVKIKK